MGKRSPMEKYLREMSRTRLGWKSRLKPPYRCPKCHRETAVFGKKMKTGHEIKFRLWCQYGCFDMTFTYHTPIKTFIDAYAEVFDYFWSKPKIVGEPDEVTENGIIIERKTA